MATNSENKGRSARGFASMDERKQREIASKGGKASHQKGTAHEFSSDEARAAGKKGGEATAQSHGREFYETIGRKGGEAVSQDSRHMAEIGRKGGEAVSQNRQHMAEIGRRGGEAGSESRRSEGRAGASFHDENMEPVLHNVHFPADKKDLVEQVRGVTSDENMLSKLDRLPDHQYRSPQDVIKDLNASH